MWSIGPILLIAALLWWYRRLCVFRFMEWSFYTWSMRRWVPRIRFWVRPRLSDAKITEGWALLKSGHGILTADTWKLTNIFIPGSLTHMALCISKHDVAEMVCSGYNRTTFAALCHSTRVVIVACKDWDYVYTRQVIARCCSFDGTDYDAQFTLGIQSLYCSELIYQSDFQKRWKVSVADLMGLGRPYISPQAYYDAENTEIVWDSDNIQQGA